MPTEDADPMPEWCAINLDGTYYNRPIYQYVSIYRLDYDRFDDDDNDKHWIGSSFVKRRNFTWWQKQNPKNTVKIVELGMSGISIYGVPGLENLVFVGPFIELKANKVIVG